jgi:hypothetical protein
MAIIHRWLHRGVYGGNLMHQRTSLVTTLEGLSRPAFRIGKELAQNSRSGLTVRFLAKKLELPEEEIEYVVDVNHKLLFTDITKVKLVAEGASVIKRIDEGLQNHGDVPALFNMVKSLSPHDFRALEERIGIERPQGKKAAVETLLERHYRNPDSVVEYVATREFSPLAQEIFDLLWQSPDGVMDASKLRTAVDAAEQDAEKAILDLMRGFAVIELFRFDGEDRLVRAISLLSELRQLRTSNGVQRKGKSRFSAYKGKVTSSEDRGISFSEAACRLVAAVAARPVRLRGDGELFREDRRRLELIHGHEEEPGLQTSLWVVQGLGWLARVDNELRAADVETLLDSDRLTRHEMVLDWLTRGGNEAAARRTIAKTADDLKPESWYAIPDFVAYAMYANEDDSEQVLKNAGGHWHYVSAGAAGNSEKVMARILEETFFWCGLVERAEKGATPLFRLTELGRCLLSDDKAARATLNAQYPQMSAEIIVQPNFDVVVPTQEMDPLLTVPLDQFAERRSSGQATVYTLTKEAFTRAIQEGHDGLAFLEYLLHHSRTGSLPSNVLTTLEDWRGGVKRVRMRTINVLESDDPLVVADLLHRRRFKKHLESVDSRTVVAYSKISKAELARYLEKEGFVVK